MLFIPQEISGAFDVFNLRFPPCVMVKGFKCYPHKSSLSSVPYTEYFSVHLKQVKVKGMNRMEHNLGPVCINDGPTGMITLYTNNKFNPNFLRNPPIQCLRMR